MPGRTRAALATIAKNSAIQKEWDIYDAQDKTHVLGSYSYSLETRVFYNTNKDDDRAVFLNLYSDGIHHVNMIAIKDVINRKLLYGDIAETARQLAKRGFVPFIGHWESCGGSYTGVSIAANHGISDLDILDMLKQHRQMYAARISCGGTSLFPKLPLF